MQKTNADEITVEEDKCLSTSQASGYQRTLNGHKHGEGPYHVHAVNNEYKSPAKNGSSADGGENDCPLSHETTVWIRCDVYDTGIGIPGMSCSSTFFASSR